MSCPSVTVTLKSPPQVTVQMEPQKQVVVGFPGVQGPQGEVGPVGPVGPPGPEGGLYFESVSKNIRSWNATYAYDTGVLQTITYTSGAETIVKTFNYTGPQLTSIVLSGDTPSGIDLTKTFGYTGPSLTSVSYS